MDRGRPGIVKPCHVAEDAEIHVDDRAFLEPGSRVLFDDEHAALPRRRRRQDETDLLAVQIEALQRGQVGLRVGEEDRGRGILDHGIGDTAFEQSGRVLEGNADRAVELADLAIPFGDEGLEPLVPHQVRRLVDEDVEPADIAELVMRRRLDSGGNVCHDRRSQDRIAQRLVHVDADQEGLTEEAAQAVPGRIEDMRVEPRVPLPVRHPFGHGTA